MDDRRVLEIKERAERQLLALPGVHAVAIGGKVTGGEITDDIAIAVFVERKLAPADVPPEERIPPEIDGVRTDVIEEPPDRTLGGLPGIVVDSDGEPASYGGDSATYRPLLGGIQMAQRWGTGVGTLGLICTVTGDPNRVIAVTNHHVVLRRCADTAENQLCGQPKGNASSSRSCHDIVGRLVDAVCDSLLDVGLVQLDPGLGWKAEIEEDGVVRGVRAPITQQEAQPGTLQVKKRGAASGLTGGRVTHINRTGTTSTPDGSTYRSYTNGIRIVPNPDEDHVGEPTAFAVGGDSGSALRDLSGNVIGIVFSRSGNNANAFPIQDLLSRFATGVPPARRIQLEVATATTPGVVQTVPGATVTPMEANAEAPPAPLSLEEAERLEEEARRTRRGAWYADLFHRHREEATALVHHHRRVAVVWHRSGAAELFQAVWRAFTVSGARVPHEIQGRPVRACLEDLAAALERDGSDGLVADLRAVLPTFPDLAGLDHREILDSVTGPVAPDPSPA